MNFKKKVSGSWTDTPHYIHNTSTDTITTPAVLYPNDTTATVGLKGNMNQSGTPTPTTPIQPQETGDLTGNLLDENISSDVDETHINYNKSAPIILTAGQTYTFSCNMTCNGLYIRSAADDSNLASANNSSTLTYTPQVNVSAYCRVWNSNGITNLKPMLNSGSTVLPYEPYGYKIPILSANTTTPVYLGEVETTRKIRKLVLTGEELVYKNYPDNANDYLYYTSVTSHGDSKNNVAMCTHLPYTLPIPEGLTIGSRMSNSHKSLYFNFGADVMNSQPSGNTRAGIKEYLAQQYANGTPVCVWYVLATPETAVVNEPLMKIGDYADTVSGITIPTIAGANTLSVDTTLQPSEVTVNYKGWHPVADVHERDDGAWT